MQKGLQRTRWTYRQGRCQKYLRRHRRSVPHVGAGRSFATRVRARVRGAGQRDWTSGNPGTAQDAHLQQRGCGSLAARPREEEAVRKTRSSSRRQHSSSGQQESDPEGTGRGSRGRSPMVPRQGTTPRRQSAKGGCRSWPTWCATPPRRWDSSWQRSRETWRSWVQANRRRHCGPRVRANRKFLRWLHVTHHLGTIRRASSTTRNTCGCACRNRATEASFLNELTGTQTQDQPTSTKLYSVTYRELLATALPGRPSKQAPRMFVSMLRALENVVTDLGMLLHKRVRLVDASPVLGNVAVLGSSRHRSGYSGCLSLWPLYGTLLVEGSRSRQVSRVPPADNRSMLLPVRAVTDARRVHSPSAARAVPARLSALSARIQLDRSAHKEDAVRNGLRPPEPRLLTPRKPSCLQPQHCWASRNRLGLPWRLERPGKRQVRTSIANKDREHAESNSESDPRSRW